MIYHFQQCEHCDYLLPNERVTPYLIYVHWTCGDFMPVSDAHVIRWSQGKRCDCERCLRVRPRIKMYRGGKLILPRQGLSIPKAIRRAGMASLPGSAP